MPACRVRGRMVYQNGIVAEAARAANGGWGAEAGGGFSGLLARAGVPIGAKRRELCRA